MLRKAGIGSEAQKNAVHDTDDPFMFLAEGIIVSLRKSCPKLVPHEDILAEFKTDDSVEQGHSGDDIEMLNNRRKKPAPLIDILNTRSLFVDKGAEEIRQLAGQPSVLTEENMRQSQQQRSIKYYVEEMQMIDIRTEP